NPGVVIDGVRHPSASSPASACILGAVAATYTGGTSRGVSASSARAGTEALHASPSYSNGPPPRTPPTISTASRIGPSVRRPSSGCIVSCLTPMRNGGVIASILSSAEAGRGGRRSGLDAFLPRVERGERARGLHALVDSVPLEPGIRLFGAQGQELDVRG